MAKIVVTEEMNPIGPQLLKEAGHNVIEGWKLTREEMQKETEDADALMVRIMPVPKEWMDRCKKLKMMSKHGVGIDNFDIEEAKRRGIVITVTPGANAQSVAEHAFMMMLALAKNAIPIHTGYKTVGWNVKNSMEGVELFGKTLGVIGCGQIGSRIAHMAKDGLDMRVLVYDPYIAAAPAGCERVDRMDTLLEQSDFVTVHSFLSAETRHMIDADAFAKMKPTAFFINCARGPIMDEDALVKALTEKKIAGAGLDVTEQEPLPADHPLFGMPNVILTPHYAPTTKEAAYGVARMAAENLIYYFAGEEDQMKGKVCP